MNNYSSIFQPFVDLFTQSQVQSMLFAWLPTKLGSYLPGIMAVDMFLTNVLATGISALILALFAVTYSIIKEGSWRTGKIVTAQVEYYIAGAYGYRSLNPIYEALSWMTSQQTKSLNTGSFIVQPTNSMSYNYIDDCAPPDFNVLPDNDQQITVEFKGKRFKIKFTLPEQVNNNNNNNNDNINFDNINNTFEMIKPSIYLTTLEDSSTNVDAITEFLNQVTRAHKEHQKKMQVRSRYERTETYWAPVQILSSNRGLDTVALDEPHELLLRKELETFVHDKSFYERIGMPYRRGILLYGKPGTGKTSLINAISSQLSRDIYYLNLKNFKSDNELNSAICEIPRNKIIVLEDVDTQSKVIHKRTGKRFPSKRTNISSDKKENKGEGVGPKLDNGSKFSLATFLGFLDGHTLSEGNIIIMTTNHLEHLDPACIRPGRMDVQLDLDYCTHYQIKKMYKSVVESPKAEFPQDILEKIPERLLPPCEVMMTMVLYRNEIDLIPQKVHELVAKYINTKPDDVSDDSGSTEVYSDDSGSTEDDSESTDV